MRLTAGPNKQNYKACEKAQISSSGWVEVDVEDTAMDGVEGC